MISKINLYVFIQILKSCTLIFFIFLSISWLLQLTRLFTLSNLVQIDILNVIYLSLFLIPNLLSVIVPFIIIFGVLLCFLKLNRDKEIIAIFSLGLQLKPIKYSLYIFSIIIIFFYTILNFYIAPSIYEKYKLKEFELRNTINFDKMVISNFIKLNDNTTIDFKKNKDNYEDIFISFFDEKENIIFAKNGFLENNTNEYIFQLNNGFKLSLNDNTEIEKLKFENYVLRINNNNKLEFNNYDRNTLTIFEDIKNKNFLNISFKITDILIAIFIIYFFYNNNIINLRFDFINNTFYIFISLAILIVMQLLKNSNIGMLSYLLIITTNILVIIILTHIKKYFYE